MSSSTTAPQSWSYSSLLLVSVLSGTPCPICGRAEEVRADAVCFTPTATTVRRSGSSWTLQPRTSPNRNILQTLTEVRPLPASSGHTQLHPPEKKNCLLLLHSFAQYSDKETNNALFPRDSVCSTQVTNLITYLSLLSQIPLDQRLHSTLCATQRDPGSLCSETRWALGGSGAPQRRAVQRTQRWSVTAANLWRCSFASRASRKS